MAACFEKTWLEAAVASFLPEARQIMLGEREFDPFTQSVLAAELPVDWRALYPEKVPVEAGHLEWEKNLRLADALKLWLGRPAPRSSRTAKTRSLAQIAKNLGLEWEGVQKTAARKGSVRDRSRKGSEVPRWWPQVVVPEAARDEAREIFDGLGVKASAAAVCCPAGTANVTIKSWPTALFGEILAWLERERGVRAILLGHISERETLAAVQSHAQTAGANPVLWEGRGGEMALVAGLIAESRFYLGNDTGALHLAAALGRPAVSIFGGGHWPRFKPLARRSAVVVQPLPCFGCGWNCLFKDAPCVREIPVEAVQSALEWLLSDEGNEESEVVVRDAISSQGLALIAGAVAALGSPSPERKEATASPAQVTELLQNLDFSEKDRAARLQTIEVQGEEISRLQAEVERWLKESGQLWPKLNEAKNARDELAIETQNLRLLFAGSEEDRAARLRVIEEQSTEIVRLQKETDRWLREAQELWPKLDLARNERALVVAQMEELRRHFAQSEADRAARLEVIEAQSLEIARLHQETDRWLGEAQELWPKLQAATKDREVATAELAELREHFAKSEADRAARLEVIEAQAREIARLHQETDRWLGEAQRQGEGNARLQAAYSSLEAELNQLQRDCAAIESHWKARALKTVHLWPR
ncbi:MAG: glycosyltransferase family 9 protein [Chthoniobacterales bacterium]